MASVTVWTYSGVLWPSAPTSSPSRIWSIWISTGPWHQKPQVTSSREPKAARTGGSRPTRNPARSSRVRSPPSAAW